MEIKRKNNKMSRDMRSVPDPKISKCNNSNKKKERKRSDRNTKISVPYKN